MSEVGQIEGWVLCIDCRHEYKFHITPAGKEQPCDVEIGLGMEEISPIPCFCGCKCFQRPDR
jgi:hypothetical protein